MMTDHRFTSRPKPETIQDAAAWFVRLRATDGRRDRARFAGWRLQDQSRAVACREIEDVWSLAGEAAADAGIAALIEQTEPRRRASNNHGWRPGGPWIRRVAGVALALALIAGGAGLLAPIDFGPGPDRVAPAVYRTALGEQRDVALADGSVIHLDTASQVAVDLRPRGRDVQLLSGRARFTVARDPARPFVVRAGDAGVTALGTVFDVRRSGAGVDVALFHGKVEVRRDQADPAAGRVTLSPRQGVRIDTRGRPLQVRALNGDAAWGWAEGRLIFSGAPLTEVAAEINRYSTRKILLSVPEGDTRRFRGEFRSGDIDSAVLVLSTLYDLRALPNENGDVRLSEK